MYHCAGKDKMIAEMTYSKGKVGCRAKTDTEIYRYPVTSTLIFEKCRSVVTIEASKDRVDAAIMASATDVPSRFIVPAFTAISAVNGIRFSF